MIYKDRALRGWIMTGLGLCIGLFGSWEAQAQFSNEWINYGQSYYKVPIARTGVYRLTYADLQAAGVPVSGIDPRRINLFHRGKEQAILVQGQNDASFDNTDFIEFFGQRNDGTLDTDLYKPATLQPHAYYNLFSDTTAYFLTWNPLPVPGKRIPLYSDANVAGLTKENFQTNERLLVYATEYAQGLTYSGEIQSTAFDQGEGWSGAAFCSGGSGCAGQQDYTIDAITGTVPAAAPPQLEILLVGRAEPTHKANIYVGPTGGAARLIQTIFFDGFSTSLVSVPIDWTDIGSDGKLVVRVQLTTPGVRDQISVSYSKLRYAQDFNLAASTERTLVLAQTAGGRSYIELQNPAAGTRVWDVTDPENVSQLGTFSLPGGLGAVVSGTDVSRKLYIASITLSTSLRKVSFRPLNPALANYIIVTHRSLMKPALGYGDAVQSYAAYRASKTGGGYDTLTVTMDQLYNQFNYGETSPRAIFQFVKFLVNGGHPKFLFLIGKGIDVTQGYYRKKSFLPSDFRDLVPTAGWPASDMAFSAGLNGTSYEPSIPTGRLTASSPDQVAGYLNKIKETEALSFKDLWRKNLLHLSGGINEGEPALFRSYVDGFKTIAESYYLGGSTETISKQSLNVELISVKDQVNGGLNLITFFGHSGPGTIDIDIGNVSDPTLGYTNAGKYPGFLINGCNAGHFFDNRTTFGEDWVLTPNKGAKSFIAHSSFGFTGSLKQYSDIFYSVAFGDSTFLHKGLGEVQRETGRRMLAQTGSAILGITQVQQMVLLGDPAVSLFGATAPDYEVNNGSLSIVSLDGRPVTAQSAAFALDIRVRNFGRAQPGPLEIKVIRTLSDNSTLVYDSIFTPVLYSSTVRFVIRKGRNEKEFGVNNFAVVVDPGKTIPELDETNNGAAISFFVPLNGTRNIFPVPYSLVSNTSVDLVFQSTDLLSDTRAFRIEMDTAATFDSPYLKRLLVNGKVVGKTSVPLLGTDSVVYYWRTKFDKPLAGESTAWTTTSFSYIRNGPDGWGQLTYPQFSEDGLSGLTRDDALRRFKFQESVSTIGVTAFGSANPTTYTNTSLKINGEEFNVATQEQPCRNNTLNLVAFDKSSSAPYAGIAFASFFDPRACGRAPQVINNFSPGELETGHNDDLAQWVSNIQPSDSVVLYSIGDAGYASWSAGVMTQLALLGIGPTQLNGLQPGEPFVILAKKGAPSNSARIFRPSQAPPNAQSVAVNATMTGRYTSGSLTSVLIGPALKWNELNYQVTGIGASDQFSIEITGRDMKGNGTVLLSNLTGSVDLSGIDAGKYPTLEITLHTADGVDLSPVQLRHWLVSYSPMAEGLLTYRGLRTTETLQEGQDWKSSYGFTNLSSQKFSDSLLVQVDVYSADRRTSQRQTFRIKPPVPGDTTVFAVGTNTVGKAGSNDVTVYVNPRVLPEPFFDNNVLTLFDHLQVNPDRTAPVLDVTVDGRHLVNGDVVSSYPSIVATVLDKNPFIPKTDTTGINLFIQTPCPGTTCPYKRINFSDKQVTWSPATATTDFRIQYQPLGLAAGQYALKAEAVDGSGNASGALPYEVSFVVSESNGFVINAVYPNPTTDVVNFKIVVTSPEPPEDFQLQLYSSAGNQIRNLGSESLPSLHVGTNEFFLGATDANGNPLSAGIYLYRMTVTANGKSTTRTGKLMVHH